MIFPWVSCDFRRFSQRFLRLKQILASWVGLCVTSLWRMAASKVAPKGPVSVVDSEDHGHDGDDGDVVLSVVSVAGTPLTFAKPLILSLVTWFLGWFWDSEDDSDDLRPESHHEPSKRMANLELELDWLFKRPWEASQLLGYGANWWSTLRGNWWSLERQCVDQALRSSFGRVLTSWIHAGILKRFFLKVVIEEGMNCLWILWNGCLFFYLLRRGCLGTAMAALDSWFCTRKSGSTSDIRKFLDTAMNMIEPWSHKEHQRTSWMNPGKSHTFSLRTYREHGERSPKPGQILGVGCILIDLFQKDLQPTWTSPPSSCFVLSCFIYLWLYIYIYYIIYLRLFKCLFSLMSFHFHLSEFPLR